MSKRSRDRPVGATRQAYLWKSFARQPQCSYFEDVTGLEIIKEITRLPLAEQEKVRRFVRENLEPGQLPGEEIGVLVQRMVDTADPAEAKRLEDEIVRAFYGDGAHA